MKNKIKIIPDRTSFQKIVIKAVVYSIETQSLIIRCFVPLIENRHLKLERPITIDIRVKGKIARSIYRNIKIDDKISVSTKRACTKLPHDILDVRVIMLHDGMADHWETERYEADAIKYLDKVQSIISY